MGCLRGVAHGEGVGGHDGGREPRELGAERGRAEVSRAEAGCGGEGSGGVLGIHG